jgi:hypothetical protein
MRRFGEIKKKEVLGKGRDFNCFTLSEIADSYKYSISNY